ncbi:MAG: peptidase [Firmicutes bacterium HGW-Firmicutes-14]|nr:MAG: peptidase [Firmicutes bacterium HGW-Firmicutes-14]
MVRSTIPVNALELHRKLIVADGHCDTILKIARGETELNKYSGSGHIDLVRMQEGGVRVQFFAAFIESMFKPFSSLTRAMQLIDTFYSEAEACSHMLAVGLSMSQVHRELRCGKIVAVLGIEGGEVLNGDISVLRVLFRLGVRFLGLTWNQRNQIADGVQESITGGGLTQFGCAVVKEMNRLGMIIDLSHISEAGFWDVLKTSCCPVMVSHANCYSLCNHPRNLNDDQIKALARNNGIMGLSFVPQFIGGNDRAIDDFLDHVDYVAALAGTGVIALGSDFDGIDHTAAGLADCRCYPAITAGLLERGYTEKEIRGIMGNNILSLMENILKQ